MKPRISRCELPTFIGDNYPVKVLWRCKAFIGDTNFYYIGWGETVVEAYRNFAANMKAKRDCLDAHTTEGMLFL